MRDPMTGKLIRDTRAKRALKKGAKVYVVMICVNFELEVLGVFSSERLADIALGRSYHWGIVHERELNVEVTHFNG